MLFLLLLVSCTKSNKEGGSTQISEPSSGSFNYLDSINLDYQSDIEEHNDTIAHYIKNINFSNCTNIELVLREVYRRDQQYRDSLHSGKYISKSKQRFIRRKMKQNDVVNEKIIGEILLKNGWTDSCDMAKNTHMAIWLTLKHSNSATFKWNSIKYLKQALSDSLVSLHNYARLMDDTYLRNGKKQIYGTYPLASFGGFKKFDPRISISLDSVNIERTAIGLKVFTDPNPIFDEKSR